MLRYHENDYGPNLGKSGNKNNQVELFPRTAKKSLMKNPGAQIKGFAGHYGIVVEFWYAPQHHIPMKNFFCNL